MTDFEAESSRRVSETIAYCLRQTRKYGAGLIVCILFLATILKGMPLHGVSHVVGLPALAATMFFFVKTIQFSAIALSSWWIDKDFRNKGHSTFAESDYVQPKSRSGRRRTPSQKGDR
jgi:hypothetical protein